ncbi:MAG: hypothetical protein IPO64_12905 [Bacteroidetes bacterium]|nr:hypothetical protein [Bacteroidota bacterium]
MGRFQKKFKYNSIAPMGDPIAILVIGYTICIRIAEARGNRKLRRYSLKREHPPSIGWES